MLSPECMPMPEVEDMFSRLGKSKYFTTLDLRSRYHHFACGDDAIMKTVFVAPSGIFEYPRAAMTLAQAPVCFWNVMEKVFKGFSFTMVYLNDIIIFSKMRYK